MRKQTETLVHNAVVTAQEAVEGCGHAMREDFLQETYECSPDCMSTSVCHCNKNGGAVRVEKVRAQQDHEVRWLRRNELVVDHATEPRRAIQRPLCKLC